MLGSLTIDIDYHRHSWTLLRPSQVRFLEGLATKPERLETDLIMLPSCKIQGCACQFLWKRPCDFKQTMRATVKTEWAAPFLPPHSAANEITAADTAVTVDHVSFRENIL